LLHLSRAFLTFDFAWSLSIVSGMCLIQGLIQLHIR
jgi:hypothetical protein